MRQISAENGVHTSHIGDIKVPHETIHVAHQHMQSASTLGLTGLFLVILDLMHVSSSHKSAEGECICGTRRSRHRRSCALVLGIRCVHGHSEKGPNQSVPKELCKLAKGGLLFFFSPKVCEREGESKGFVFGWNSKLRGMRARLPYY